MIFNSSGNYIDECMFNNSGLKEKHEADESDTEKKPNHAIKN